MQENITSKNKVNKSSLGERIVMLVALLATFLITILSHKTENSNIVVFATFGLNGVLWIKLLMSEIKKHPFSITMIHWFFCLLFFFFAALMQYVFGSFSWVGRHEDNIIITANFLLLLWTVVYYLGTVSAEKISFTLGNIKQIDYNDSEWDGYNKVLFVLTAISITITLYRLSTIGIGNLFSLGTTTSTIESDSSAFHTLITKMMMYTTYYSVAFSIYKYKKSKNMFFILINGVCLLISYFPTAIARNNVAGIYLGLMLIAFSSLRKSRKFILVLFLAFMIFFPFLNAFRLSAFSQVDIGGAIESTVKNISRAWIASDYDAYSMFCTTIEYTTSHGFSLGVQLLGVVLFWIPRSVWPSKPGGTGEMIGGNLNWAFTNVSEPLPAEAYINFGIIGIFIFAYFFGFLFGKLDNLYWKNSYNNINAIHKFDSLYYFIVSYCLFFFRGAMLSATAYMVASIVAWYIFTRNNTTIKVQT